MYCNTITENVSKKLFNYVSQCSVEKRFCSSSSHFPIGLNGGNILKSKHIRFILRLKVVMVNLIKEGPCHRVIRSISFKQGIPTKFFGSGTRRFNSATLKAHHRTWFWVRSNHFPHLKPISRRDILAPFLSLWSAQFQINVCVHLLQKWYFKYKFLGFQGDEDLDCDLLGCAQTARCHNPEDPNLRV
jgi:hypothetical protein